LRKSAPKLPSAKSQKFVKGVFEVLKHGNFTDKYTIGKNLGSGAFGSVNLCSLKDQPDNIRAVKQIKKKDA
jgi:hypothetical protein